MDFAKNQLLKYGWKEGDGLGKNNDGISTALKPKLKFDKFGMGHDPAKEFTNRWWENTYKNALENVEVTKSEGEIKVKTKCHFEDLDRKQKKANYNSFLRTSTLTNLGHEVENPDKDETPEIQRTEIKIMSDEDLLKACGKRTAHKGARHGLNLSGKLARIKAQEEELLLLDKYKKHRAMDTSINEDENIIKKKKNKQMKSEENNDLSQNGIETTEVLSDEEKVIKKKKKKSKSNVEERDSCIDSNICIDSGENIRKKKKKRKVESEVCDISINYEITEQKHKKKKKKADKSKIEN